MDNIKLGLLNFYQTQNYSRRFVLIMLISAVSTIVVPLQRTTDRSIIFESFVEHQNQRDNSSRLIPCITTFIEEYFDYPDRILFLLPRVLRDITDFVVPLISELRARSAIYTLNMGMTDIMGTRDASTVNAVILSESAIAFEGSDICFSNYCKRDCNFVIVLTNPFVDTESFLIEADTIVKRICLGSILKLAIVAFVQDSVLFAGSPPARTGPKIYPASAGPVLLGRCEREVTAIRWQRFAGQTNLSHDTCVVNAAMFENFPFALLINDTDYLRFGGVEGLMMEEIARSMKVKLNRETIVWSNKSIGKELYLRLYNSTRNDLVFGGLLRNLNRKVEFTTSYGMAHIAWMVPIETNVSLRGLITPFSANVWYSIICVLIIGGLAKRFLIRDISFLDIAALVLGVSTIRQPVRSSSRIQFIAWALFGFFVTQFYLGSLADNLMNAANLQIESMEELISSGLQIGGTAQLANLLKMPDEADEEDEVRRTIREDEVIIFEQHAYINQIQDLVAGRNTSLALIVMLNLSNIHHISDLGHAHFVKETVGNYPLAFATWQAFPYLSDINFKIQTLFQAGVVGYWSNVVALNGNYYEEVSDEDDNTKLDLDDVTPAFLLLITGYLGGCCLLIIEIIFYPSRVFL